MSPLERGLYRIINVVVRALLRSPLHGLLGRRILLLALRGRKSGRSLSVPLSYLRDGEGFLLFTSGDWSAWWKHSEGGAPVTARVRGRRLVGMAQARVGGDTADPGADQVLERPSRARPDATGWV